MSGSDLYVLRRGVVDPAVGTQQAWGWLNLLSDEDITGTPGVTVGTARISAGHENSLHIHPNCAEIILFLAGSVEHVVGSDIVEVSHGDMLIVPAGVPHQARNVGSDLVEMVVIYNAGQRRFELAV